MPNPMDLCRCEHTREAHARGTGFCEAWRASREMQCSCSAFVDRDRLHREWVASHPEEALVALEAAGVLAKRWMVPESPYVTPERRTWRIFDDPSRPHPTDRVTEVWTRIDTLPPLIGEEGGDDE